VPGEEPDGLSCSESCEYDFSEVPQWYCNGKCSPLGDPVGPQGCDQADADLYCQLLTNDPEATSSEWEAAAVIDAPGFCCLLEFPELGLGPLPAFGVSDLCYKSSTLDDEVHTNGYALHLGDVTCL